MSTASSFSWPLRVYWEDTDAGGVVYHAGYLRFLERARSEWLRSLGLEQGSWRETADRVFAIRSAQLDFLLPARLDDELLASVELRELRGASMQFAQLLSRPADGALLVRARVGAVCLRASDFRPAPIPSDVAQLLRSQCADVSNPSTAE